MIDLVSTIILGLFLIFTFFNLKNEPKFEPRKFLAILVIFYCIIPSILIHFIGDNTPYYTYNTNLSFETLLIIFIFYMSFYFGASLFNTRRSISNVTVIKNFDPNVILIAFVFLGMSLLAKLYLIKLGLFFLEDKYSDAHTVSIPGIIKFFNNIHILGFLFFTIYFFSKEGKRPKSYYIYIIYTVGIAVIQGRRFGVIYPFLVIGLLLVLTGKIRVRKVFVSLITLSGIGLVISLYRLAQARVLTDNEDAKIVDIIAYIFSSNSTDLFIDLFASLVSRIGNPIIMVNFLVEKISINKSYSSFNSIYLIFASIVPSAIWKNKPPTSIGNLFGREVGLISHLNFGTKINPGWIGELYYNGDLLYVLLGGFILGILIKAFYKLVRFDNALGLVIFFNYFILMFSGFQMELAFSINTFIKSTVLSSVVVFIFSPKVLANYFKNRKDHYL